MKFRIFRSAEDQTGAGSVDPTEAPRMGGQVLPEIAPSKGAAAEPRIEERRTAENWTFERTLGAADPNWVLARVEAASA